MKKEEIKIEIFYKLSEELKDKWLNFEKESSFHFFQKYEFIENFLHKQNRNCTFIILSRNNGNLNANILFILFGSCVDYL